MAPKASHRTGACAASGPRTSIHHGGKAAITDGFEKALELKERGQTAEAKTSLDATRAEFQVHVQQTNDTALARELTLIDRLRTML